MPSPGTILTLENMPWYTVAYQSPTGPALESLVPHHNKDAVIAYIKNLQATRNYHGYVLVKLTPLFQETPGYQPPFPSSPSASSTK